MRFLLPTNVNKPKIVKVKGGFRIQYAKGKTFPKLYKTVAEVKKRIGEIERHAPKDK